MDALHRRSLYPVTQDTLDDVRSEPVGVEAVDGEDERSVWGDASVEGVEPGAHTFDDRAIDIRDVDAGVASLVFEPQTCATRERLHPSRPCRGAAEFRSGR